MAQHIRFDPAHEVTTFAAEEWRRYAGALTGRARAPARSKPGGQNVVIAVQGDAVFDRLPGPVRRRTREIRHDGFAAGAYRGTAYIAALQPRGALFGVYDLLEREGGIVFAAPGPGGEYVPRLRDVVVRAPLAVRNPRLPLRAVAFHLGTEVLTERVFAEVTDWLAKRKFSGLGIAGLKEYEALCPRLDPEIRRRGLNLDVGGHSARHLLPPEQYAATHPGFFAVDAAGRRYTTNLCYSNAAMRAELARRVGDVLARHPAITEFGLWPPDGVAACQCGVCRTRPPGYWTYQTAAFVARRIRRAHPAVRIMHLAYDLYTRVPPGVQPLPGNVAVQFCEYWDRAQNLPLCDYRQGRDALKDEAEHRAFAAEKRCLRNHRQIVAEMAGWLRATRCPTVFSYYSDLQIRKVINHAAAAIRQDLAFYQALGMQGFTDCLCYPARWMASALNLYALGVYAWDEQPDPSELARRLGRGLFGPGAEEPVAEYYAALDELENRPCTLGFNPYDLLHRSPKEIAHFAGVVDELVEPTRRTFEERLARLRACVKAVRALRGVDRRHAEDLRQMTVHLEFVWRLHWAYYLAIAHVARRDKRRGAAALREAARALRAYAANTILDGRFRDRRVFNPRWYRAVRLHLRQSLAGLKMGAPESQVLVVGVKG